MEKIKKTACILFMILFLISPAYGEMLNSTQEAADTAVAYAAAGEETWAYGPYYYQSHSYYYIQYLTNGTLTGVLLLDGENGEIIKETETVEKISYTIWYLNNVTPEVIPAYNITVDTYQKTVPALNEMARKLEQEARQMSGEDKTKTNDAAAAYKEMAVLIEEYADTLSNTIPTMEAVASGNRSYENAIKLTEEYGEVEKVLIEMGQSYDNVIENVNAYCDILIENSSKYGLNKTLMQDYKTVFNTNMEQEKALFVTANLDAFEEDRLTVKEHQEEDTRLAEERIQITEIPGFGMLLSICAVLLVCCLISRKKK
ncbi:MAG: hypothetical protein LBU81_04465 [Methanosarcinales archaeon]|jgi:hypothetical protein|nr:hypothetical protein [Methanosarcinales archaeon]